MSSKKKGLNKHIHHQEKEATRPTASKGNAKITHTCGGSVLSVAFSPDNRYYAAAGTHKVARVFTTSDSSQVAKLHVDGSIQSILFGCASDGRSWNKLLIGTFGGSSSGGKIYIYDVQTQREESMKMFGHDGDSVNAMALAGDMLVAGGRYTIVYTLTFQLGAAVLEEQCRLRPNGAVLALALDNSANLLVTGGEAKVVEVWSIRDVIESQKQKQQQPPFRSSLREASTQENVLGEGGLVAHFLCGHTVHALALTPDAKTLAVGTSAETEMYHLTPSDAKPDQPRALGRPLRNKAAVAELKAAVSYEPLMLLNCPAPQGGVAFSADGRRLVIGGQTNVQVFDVECGATLRRMSHAGRVRCVALSSDGLHVLAGGFDGVVARYAVSEGTRNFQFLPPAGSGLVRSVDLCPSASLLAAGGDTDRAPITSAGGGGFARVYDTLSQLELCAFELDKPCWCVRLSPAGALLSCAGYDSALSLFDLGSKQLLHRVDYPEPTAGGPAFVWSLSWAADGGSLAVGCWNGHGYLYCVDEPEAAGGEGGTGDGDAAGRARLRETHVVERTDRVYAVSLSFDGSHLAIGGRDKRVALYEMRATEGADAASAWRRAAKQAADVSAVRLVWEATADDFVYVLKVSSDLRYCVFGGTGHRVSLLDGGTGRHLYDIDGHGVVWSLALLEGAPPASSSGGSALGALGSGAASASRRATRGVMASVAVAARGGGVGETMLAVGGDGGKLSLYPVEDGAAPHEVELEMPVDGTVYSVVLTGDSICYANGRRATMYGNGHGHYGWRDQPSYSVVSRLLLSMLGSEERLCRALMLLLRRHPAIVNSRRDESPKHDSSGALAVQLPGSGTSLLQLLVRQCSFPSVLQLMLQASCRVGLLPDARASTALDTAIQHGRWFAVQQLIKKVLAGEIAATPQAMGRVVSTFKAMSRHFPRLFLQLLSGLPLQQETEVLEGEETHNVRRLPRLTSARIHCDSPHQSRHPRYTCHI